jgi:hypothetical protein
MTLRSYMSKRRIFVAIAATVALLGIVAGGAAAASNQHAHTVAVHLAAAKAAKAAAWKAAAPARAAAALTAAWKLGNSDANTMITSTAMQPGYGYFPNVGQSPAAWCNSSAANGEGGAITSAGWPVTDSAADSAANLVASYSAGCMAAVKTDAVQIKGQQVAAAKAAAAAKVAAAKAAAAAAAWKAGAPARAAAAAQAAAAKAAAAKAARLNAVVSHLTAVFADLKAQASLASGIGGMWMPGTDDDIMAGAWSGTNRYSNDLSNFEGWAAGLSSADTFGSDLLQLGADGATMSQDWSSGMDASTDYTTFESDAATVASDCGIALLTPQSEGFQ